MFKVITCLVTEHDYRLVLLAGLVCFAASLTAMRLYSRMSGAKGLVRGPWPGVAYFGI